MKYDFLDHEMIARLGSLPLEVRRPMLGQVAGRHRSPNRGSSVEFAEYRKYVQGDDTRRLDWKAYARSDRHYIKEFEADTNLRAYFILDTSGSMNFTSGDLPKIAAAKKIISTLAYLAADQGDAAGLSCCNEKLHLEIPARQRPAHLQHIFQTLNKLKPKGETGLVQAIHDVAEKTPQRALIIILSDFFCDGDALHDALMHMRHKKHDIAVFHMMDRQEIDFHFERPHRFVDMEDNTSIVAEPNLIAGEYRSAVQDFLRDVKKHCHDCDADYRLTITDDDIENSLKDFLIDRLPKGK